MAQTQGNLRAERWDVAHDLVRRQALSRPDLTAVRDGGDVSYGELAARWRRLANRLRAEGVGPEVPVAVHLGRSVDAIVTLLAVLQAGGVYAPIDSSYPPSRAAAVIENLRAKVLVTDADQPPEVRGTGVDVLDLRQPIGEAPEQTGAELDMGNLAYVLHTSGSTGTPKGVAMTHRGLSRLIHWQIESGPAGLATLNFTPTGFDVTFQEVFSTLATGGRLTVVSEDVRKDPERLLSVLHDDGIERVFLPYVALQQLAKASQRLSRYPQKLRHVVTAGEQLVITDAIAAFCRHLPECRLDNHYGPTETHLATSYSLTRQPWPAAPPIGTPVSGADVYLLDADLKPVLVGETGELYVGGDSVARGYLNAPAQTADRFLPDPFAPEPGTRMYRTGDLAQLDQHGLIHFLGRADGQLKIRGYRVEPADVEHTLAACPAIREVAVGLRQLGAEVGGLVAYLVVDETPSIAELTAYARTRLPEFMVPARFVFLDKLPLTTTGKIDRNALADVELPEAPDVEGSTAEIVRAIWQRVLGHDEFETDDDFFDVGGDSVLAAWVVTELSQALGQEISLSVLLEASTVEELVEQLSTMDSQRPDPKLSEIVTLDAGRSTRALFLLPALGGEPFAYRELAKELTSPLRVLGVRWAGELGDSLSVQEIARIHAEQIQAIQPQGPYLLAGWSFGGVLAFEVARQLTEAGSEIGFLGLLDANPVLDPITGLRPVDTPYLGLLDDVLDRGRQVDPADAAWIGLMGEAATGGPHLTRYLSLARDCIRANIAYRAERYAGDIELFQAASTPVAQQAELVNRLREVAAGTVRVHRTPGDHTGMLRAPNVGRLAEAIDAVLQRSGKE